MEKKTDYFGRELNTGDVVIIQYRSKMEIGVCINNKIRTKSTVNYAPTSKYIYKLENPTTEELMESQQIITAYSVLEEKKKNAQKAKGKAEYGTLVGGVYTTERTKYLYLGEFKITYYDKDNNITKKHEGKYYYETYNFEHFKKSYTKKDIIINSMYKKFNKGYKKITGLYSIMNDFKNPKDLLGTYDYSYYDWNTHKYEIGKIVVEEYNP